ncbi:uncharacterized protein ColSpa_08171 [Colletotrichum spaethianum]|uniref:Uncharacterized protein n=1 Tax=Colletotrichum spaethianum TaxID=700344 RepID=A0AA37P986_9PEZI|nr:uncharacterized protein ColSpa_08171 [Colletotrichum spaethianum]GKT47990.1 hypothetical protein ColSpa_08171 [Colletotrichum spaethianum]
MEFVHVMWAGQAAVMFCSAWRKSTTQISSFVLPEQTLGQLPTPVSVKLATMLVLIHGERSCPDS